MAETPGVREERSYYHLFDTQAASYAVYRPTYPDDLYQKVYSFAGCSVQNGYTRLAVDVATGSGQCAASLARHFTKVIGIDPNEKQLAQAKKAHNVEYRQATAEETQLEDNSVDLITVAQALHWLDTEAFFMEAARILRPTGALAAWGYRLCKIPDNEQADQLLVQLSEVTFAPFWTTRRYLIQEEYASIEPQGHHFGEVQRARLPVRTTTTVARFIGYLATWSANALYQEANPGKPSPLVAFKTELAAALGASGDVDNFVFPIVWPMFLLLAKKPQKKASHS